MEVISRHRTGRPRVVNLTPPEQDCKHRFDTLVDDQGATVLDAAMQALAAMLPRDRSQEFVSWLSHNTLRMTLDKRVIRNHGGGRSRPPLGGTGEPTGGKGYPS